MLQIADKYTYRVTWSDEDNEYVGLCAELSSLSWLAATPEEALKGIRSAVKKCIKDLTQTGESIPKAITSKKYSGKFMVRVPPELHRQLAIKAAEEGVSLNRVVSSKLAQ